MLISNLKNFKAGWIFGNFDPSVVRTKMFELGIHRLEKGHKSDFHYHRMAMEYNIIISGKLLVSGKELGPDDIFIYDSKDRSDVECLEDACLVVVKIPSVPNDKYYD